MCHKEPGWRELEYLGRILFDFYLHAPDSECNHCIYFADSWARYWRRPVAVLTAACTVGGEDPGDEAALINYFLILIIINNNKLVMVYNICNSFE